MALVGDSIDAQLVDRCRAMLLKQIDECREVINSYTSEGVCDLYPWVSEQQGSKQQGSLRWLLGAGIQVSVAYVHNAIDSAFALADLLDRPDGKPHYWSYLVLSRSVVEAAVLFAHLNDRQVSVEQRILRMAACLLKGRLDEGKFLADLMTYESEMAESSLGAAHREGWKRDMEELNQHLARCRMAKLTDARDQVTGLSRGNERTYLRLNVTTRSGELLRRAPAPYRVGSAATHSAWWYLAGSIEQEGTSLAPRLELGNLQGAVVQVLDALWVMADSCAAGERRHLADALDKKTNQRVRIVMRGQQPLRS